MWNRRRHAAMAIAGAALAVAAVSPVSAQYRNDGNAGAYGYGWPFVTPGVPGYGRSGAAGCGSLYSAASYAGGWENGQGAYGAATVRPAERARPVIRRRASEPKRLE
jgi:hypothetical protein